MSETIDVVTAQVHRAIKELQAACPDSGFIVIGMTEFEGQTGVSMACNVDDTALRDTLTSIVEDKGEDIYPSITRRMMN